MSTKHTLFNTVFCTLTDFCDVKPSQIADGVDLQEATVRAWRTRGIPKKEYYQWLIQSLKKILAERSVNSDALKDRLREVWSNAPIWDGGESIANYIERLLDAAYDASRGVSPEATFSGSTQKRRLVVFGLNGTLFKGVRYTWELAFRAAGLDWEKHSQELKEQFEDGKLSYEKWCEQDCRVLRDAGLTYEKLRKTVLDSKLRCIGNLEKAVKALKANGHKVVIISGGIDSVLYAMLPNANELFDEIYINRFCYDEQTGILKSIIPTTYDWDTYSAGVEGKQSGLMRLCERYGVRRRDSAFAGDDFNDMGALKAAGMKIFTYSYPSRGKSRRPDIRSLPYDVIFETGNDLMKIAERIIRWDFGDSVEVS